MPAGNLNMKRGSKTHLEPPAELEYPTRCRILRKLASGGMGDVYLAEQLGDHGFRKIVAIKTIRRETLGQENGLEMFISEAKLGADLVHDNIGHIYNLCASSEMIFIIMEYIKGITLATFLRSHKDRGVHVDPEMAAFIASRVARALSYAHNKTDHEGARLGIVHRDVTPANIMIDTLGVVKLTDFGIAKAVTGSIPDEGKVLMGKYPYMSPEQVAFKGTDARSDIYALGVVFYEIVVQAKLYPAKSREDLIRMQADKLVDPPDRLCPWVKPELSSIVMKMISKDPADRFVSARKVVLALEHYMYEAGYGPTNEKLARYIKHLLKK